MTGPIADREGFPEMKGSMTMSKSIAAKAAALGLFALAVAGCTTTERRATGGALIGGGAGAIIGGIAGGGTGAAIGAATAN